jgi:beta-fructofuranosidase
MNKIFYFLIVFFTLSACYYKPSSRYEWDFNVQPQKITFEKNTNTKYTINSNFDVPEFVNGTDAEGLRFDGYSTFIKEKLPGKIDLPLSITAWVALETYPTDTAGFFSLSSGDSKNWISASVNPYGKPVIVLGLNGKENYFVGETAIPKFKWFNVGLNIVNNKVSLLINGKEVKTVPLAQNAFEKGLEHISIGRDEQDKYFDTIFPLTRINGIIDEVKIWKGPLTTRIINALGIASKKNIKPDLSIPESRFRNDFNRPKFHLLPAANWTNETHGFVHYNGKYHIFNQKNGTNLFLGQINWGHFSSPDLVQWTEHKPALTPEEGYDQNGIWSGHVVKDEKGNPVIMYTGGDGAALGMCLAFPKDNNLVEWEKYENNPVVKSPPKQYKRIDFHDPYLWKENETWYMIVGYGITEDQVEKGTVLLYKSKDLKKWEFLHPFFIGDPKHDGSGIFWEMPVFWKMNDKYILLVNPVPYDGKPAISVYWVGQFVNEKFVPDTQLPQKLEVINRMLSPSVTLDTDGRTTAIAIIPDLISRKEQLKQGWTHLYSIPRTWNLIDGQIHQAPHPAIQKLRDTLKTFKSLSMSSGQNIKIGKGHQIEIIAEITPTSANKFGFVIGKNEQNGEETKIYFDLETNQLIVDQSKTSKIQMMDKRVEVGDCKLKKKETVKIQLFIDGSVVEGFINDKDAFTTRIFPKFENSNEIEIFCEGGDATIEEVKIWNLRNSKNQTDF